MVKQGYSIWENLKEAPDHLPDSQTALRLIRDYREFSSHHLSISQNFIMLGATDPPTFENLNRHAILHGAMDYWSEANTAKLMMFFDLTLKLEKVRRLIIGPAHDQI